MAAALSSTLYVQSITEDLGHSLCSLSSCILGSSNLVIMPVIGEARYNRSV